MPKASRDWKEIVPPDEDAHLEALATQLRDLQRRRAARTGQVDRALHAKGNLGLEAELTVSADLPEALRVGIFAAPAAFQAYVRYSNGAGARQHDGKGDVRGLAVKVLGVPGKKLIPGLEDARTQDLLFIRTPTMPMRTPDEFVAVVRAAESPALLPFRLATALGLRRTVSLLGQLSRGLREPMPPLASTRYWTVLPIRWGEHAAKLSLVPRDPPVDVVPRRVSANALGDELAARLARGPVDYDLRVQLFVDEERTPIEDPTVEWGEDVAPFTTVARLSIPSQDPTSEEGRALSERVEAMSFDPWHAPVEFRPLGAMMRARNHAYRLSTMERGAAPEPDDRAAATG